MGRQKPEKIKSSLGKFNPKPGQLSLIAVCSCVSNDVLVFLRKKYSITTLEEFFWAVRNGLTKPTLCKTGDWNFMVGLAYKRCKKELKRRMPKVIVMRRIIKGCHAGESAALQRPIPIANLDEMFK